MKRANFIGDIMKSKRSFYNIAFGFLSQLMTIAFGLVIPRLFLVNFGSEVNGFMSSITQIFVYLSIFEAGVGAATIQVLYKHIATDDKQGINSILSATSKYYKRTAGFYFLAVVTMSIIYPLFIKSEFGNATVFFVILLTGMGGVINFFFQAKFILLLTAEGKGYIVGNIVLITTIISNAIKIALIINGSNLILIQLFYFIGNLLQMILISVYIKKHYTWIDLNVKPNYAAISKKSSALIHQISGMVFANTDVLILTIFCGLKVVSVYVMYNLIFQMINGLISNINSGFVFVLGSVYNENRNKFMNLYNSYELYYLAIVFALYSITYILILPFMKLYTAGVTDINYIDIWLPVLFVIANLMSLARMPAGTVITIAGHFKETQYRSILESIINIVVSLICVNMIGIYGVLIGTIVALLYRTNDIIIYTNKHIFERSSLIAYKRWFINIVLLIAIVCIAIQLDISPNSYIDFTLTGLILLVTIVPIFFIVVSIFDIKSFKFAFGYLKKLMKIGG